MMTKSVEVTSDGSVFQNRAAETVNARSPSVDCRVTGTTTSVIEAERNLCRGSKSFAVSLCFVLFSYDKNAGNTKDI